MSGDVAAHFQRRENQSPAHPNSSLGRTAPPAARCIPDGNRAGRCASSCGIFGDILRHDIACSPPEERFDPPLDSGSRSAAPKLIARQLRTAGPILAPADPDFPAFNWNERALHERLGGLHLRNLRLNPFALVQRPSQRGSPARTPRAGQLEHPGRLVEAKPEPPRISHASYFDRGRECGLERGLRAVARPHDIRALQRRPR